MANKIQKFCLLARVAGEYILYQLSSNSVQMKDGKTLQKKIDEIDDSITSLSATIKESNSTFKDDVSDLDTRCTNVETTLSTRGTRSSTTGTMFELKNATGTASQQFTLNAGLWLVVVHGYFSTNATGRRFVKLSTQKGNVTAALGCQSMQAVSGGYSLFTYTNVLNLDKKTTYYINLWQNSGKTLNARTWYSAIRLK